MIRRQYAWRSRALAFALAFVALTIIFQMIRIQTSAEAAAFREQAVNYASEVRTFYPNRGEIYDRNGHLLAGNRIVYEVGVNLKAVQDVYAIAWMVSAQLNLNYDTLLNDIVNPPIEGLTYLVLADYVEASDVEVLKQLQKDAQDKAPEGTLGSLTGLEFKAHPQRSYPEGSLAANVLGFVNREGRGYFGVEEKYNDLLAGNPVQVSVPTDPNAAVDIPRVPNGSTLILTIDRDLQSAVETILDSSLQEYGAQSGVIVVMNPRDGEILAMTSSRRMDLNNYWEYPSVYDNASEFNPAVSMPYEPGSVLKILTMAAAMDRGTVSSNTYFLDTGSIVVGGATIRNWDQKAWGQQDMTGCLQHSLNVCMAWISTQMGPQSFYAYMNSFGIGHLTGIDLGGEAAGRLKSPGDADWYPVDLGTNAFGQGVAATPIQIMMATTSIANDGRMVAPRVLHSMLRDGRQYNASAQFAGIPVSQETADTLSLMLANSLEGESSLALVPGYRVAGKTGTAQIPTPFGFYDGDQTNASFIGWGPVDDPQFMIYVWLERPTTSIWGSQTAAPVFAKVARKTVVILDLPPDDIRQELAKK